MIYVCSYLLSYVYVVCSFIVLVYLWFVSVFFCFFKHKTAYEMRISDWSSDVCSSDLGRRCQRGSPVHVRQSLRSAHSLYDAGNAEYPARTWRQRQIGRASCRERVCQYV